MRPLDPFEPLKLRGHANAGSGGAILPRVDPQAEIEGLVAHEGRWPGTDAERRAANHLADRLRDIGREASTEATSVHPRYALTHLLHALMAIGGGLAATAEN